MNGESYNSRSVTRGLWLLYAGLGLLVFLGSIAYYYTTYGNLYRDRYQVLAAIGSLKVDQMTQWKRERMADAIRSARSPYFLEGVSAWLQDPENPALQNELQFRLELERNTYSYSDVLLLNADGEVMISASAAPVPSAPEVQEAIERALETGEPTFSSFYRADGETVTTDVVNPLRLESSLEVVYLVLRANAAEQLFPLIETWPTISPTAEAFLLQADHNEVVFLNELRHVDDAAFSLRFPLDRLEMPAVQAALGRVGEFEGMDYRGEAVVANLRGIPNTCWYLVSKIDRAEIVDEARRQAVVLAILGALALLLAVLASGDRYRRRETQLYRRLYEQEHAEREAQETYRTILYSIGDGVITTDPDSRVRHMNAVAEALTGWKEAEAIGKPLEEVFSIVNDDTGESIVSPVKRVIAEGGAVGLANHTLLIARDGTRRPIADSGAPIYGQDNALRGVVLVFRDQSEERAAEAELRASEAMFRTVFNLQFQFMAILDRDGRIIQINDLPLFATGTTRKDIVGKYLWEPIWWEGLPEMKACWPVRLAEAAMTRGPLLTNDQFRDAQGEIREAEVATTAVFDVDDEVTHYIIQATDVTERKRAERELKEAARKLQNAQRIAHLGHWELDIPKQQLSWSEMIYDLFGTTAEAFPGDFEGFMAFVHPDDRAAMLAAQEATLSEGVPLNFEHRIIRGDGEIRCMRERAEIIYVNGEKHFLSGTVQDVTDIRYAEDRVRQMTDRLQGILDHSPLVISEMDLEGRYLLFNKAGCDFFGLPEEEIVGKTCAEMFPAEVAARFLSRLRDIVEGHKPTTVEDSFTENGVERIFSTVLFPLTSAAGTVHSVGGIAQDVTSKVLAEREQQKLAEQLRQAQKMEAVGRLAGGVAHDFNNMLGVILGHAEMALECVQPREAIHEDLSAIVNAAKRSSSLTSQLLAFARKQAIAPQVLDLNETIDSMIRMVSRLMTENIELVWKPALKLWPVHIDPAQLDQILVNLTINARDAIKGHGRITIETGETFLEDDIPNSYGARQPGEYVYLMVTDNGSGIPKEDMPRLFEPFFTTKPQGEGTGLGLATVYGIVSQNGGFVNVYSEVGLGTSVKIYFPRYQESPNALEIRPTPTPVGLDIGAKGETILLVEDEEALLNLTKRILEQQGYNVIPVNDPRKVGDVADAHEGEIQLLVTDVIMPGLSGRECWEQLHARYPRLKCLFMSGYTADVIANHGVLEEGIAFIQKPFTGKTLAAKVREVLDSPEAP